MTAETTDHITATAATRTTRSLAVIVVAAAVPGLLRVRMTAAAAHTRPQIQMTTAKCNLETLYRFHHHKGGWDMPIIVDDAIVVKYATSAASPEAGAVSVPSQIAEVDAVPAPEEFAQVVAPPLQVDVLAAGDDDLVVATLEGGN
ncbi:hypothetical protein DYB31_004888 [Aphanomyces astaci]|uniref:Uncharacterized protein n=1 Tax=Aphanomyces astaci TaxID=112090 RepID=A0A397FLJ4_APHAT|nr:hypothetical protein DYB31_004888 [Aphanomyces astaci]